METARPYDTPSLAARLALLRQRFWSQGRVQIFHAFHTTLLRQATRKIIKQIILIHDDVICGHTKLIPNRGVWWTTSNVTSLYSRSELEEHFAGGSGNDS